MICQSVVSVGTFNFSWSFSQIAYVDSSIALMWFASKLLLSKEKHDKTQ